LVGNSVPRVSSFFSTYGSAIFLAAIAMIANEKRQTADEANNFANKKDDNFGLV